MLRARHPHHSSRDEGTTGSTRGGGRVVYALMCETCGRAVIYGDTPVDGEPGYACRKVPLARVHRKPACTCGWVFYASDTAHASPQVELFVEEACS
jgi:hypothetical protein